MTPMRMLLTALAACFFAGDARGQTPQLPALAIQAEAADAASRPVAESIEQVVRADLSRSGRAAAAPAPDGALRGLSELPDFAALGAAGVRLALVIQVLHAPQGLEQTAFRLYDVASRTQVSAFSYITTPDNRRRIAHRIADRVLVALSSAATFDSRIVAIRGRGDTAQVFTMDSDGANLIAITARGAYAAPRFALHNMVVVARSEAEGGRLVTINLDSGRQEQVPDSTLIAEAGIDTALHVDSSRRLGFGVYVAYAQRGPGGDADIQVARLHDGGIVRAWALPQWQGAPAFAPDGERIAFLSGEGAARRIMVGSLADGETAPVGPQGDYQSLDWSPDGAHLAFVRRVTDAEELCIMPAGGGDVRVVLRAAAIGGPSWSPGGSLLLFETADGYEVVDAESGRRTRVPMLDLSGASWSPLLP